jgi:hypothetical protein
MLCALVVVGASCATTEPVPPASPSSAFPLGSPASGPTSVTGSHVTGAVGPASGDLTGGKLELRISGDVDLEASLPRLISGIVTPAPGALAVVWTGAGTDATTVGVGGSSFVGSRSSSATLVVTITARAPQGTFTWVSSAGECEVELGAAGTDRVAGSFTCRDLAASAGEIVDASATFSATG